VLEAVERDKKRGPEGVGFVLCAEPGAIAIGQHVDADRVRAAVQELADSG
jgi:3-dehydroquinate synthetase